MKKALVLIISVMMVLAFALTACGSGSSEESAAPEETTEATTEETKVETPVENMLVAGEYGTFFDVNDFVHLTFPFRLFYYILTIIYMAFFILDDCIY